jgi:hypothetical protein
VVKTAPESHVEDSGVRTHARERVGPPVARSGPGIATDGPAADLTPGQATQEAAKALGRAAIRDYARKIRSRRDTWSMVDEQRRVVVHCDIHTQVWLRSYADPDAVIDALRSLGNPCLVHDACSRPAGVYVNLIRSAS